MCALNNPPPYPSIPAVFYTATAQTEKRGGKLTGLVAKDGEGDDISTMPEDVVS